MAAVGSPLIFAVGIVGNIMSFLVILAPVPTFYRVYKRKSTESFQSVPYAMALLSAMLWLYYALLHKDLLLLTINVVGTVVETVYLSIYLAYAPKQARAFTLKLVGTMNLALYGAMVVVLQFCIRDAETRVTIAGGIGSAFALAVFVAPLAIIRQVIRTKSVEFLPFWLSFFLTISAIVWFFYGLLMKDFFVATPNVLGLLFGLAQMALHLVYKNPKKNGAVSEVLPADAEKAQVQLQQQQKEEAAPVVVAATVGADGEVVQGRDDHDDMRQSVAVVDITLPPPEEHPVMPQLEQPAPLPPMRMAVEVV
ncbi:bidirectional sugar transporter SWEET12-like [Lolium rigidum]|uniref:bidirectional sugar transporter SWEET12-like n=1 Tax=Lolium rigidum TaxID=89674 RepID=UPI001F5D01A1|nr:bidirectional sugar transporter SWEET12-like [Lolium rigidum]